jgi:hypothetical protein
LAFVRRRAWRTGAVRAQLGTVTCQHREGLGYSDLIKNPTENRTTPSSCGPRTSMASRSAPTPAQRAEVKKNSSMFAVKIGGLGDP